MASSSGAGSAIPLENVRSNTRGGSVPHTTSTPYSLHQPMTQQQTYSAMYDKVREAKRLAGEDADRFGHFYTDLDVLKTLPKGWPTIAATKMYFPNYNSHRAFKLETHAVLTCFEQKIHCVANKLDEMNFEDAEVAGGQPLRSLPFDREKFIARCLQGPAYLSTATPEPSQDSASEPGTSLASEHNTSLIPESGKNKLDRMAEKENLLSCLEILLKEYYTLLHIHHENLKFPRVSRLAHEAHFQAARNRQGDDMDDEACAFMRHVDDWIYPEPDVIFRRFETLLYTKSKGLTQFLKHLCCLLCFDRLPSSSSSSEDDPRVRYSLRGFDRFFKFVLGISSMALLAGPVSILYLETDWSRAAYLGIVVAFSSVFCFVMTILETNTARMIVGLAAFFAVLCAFLSNNVANCGVQ
ncbi:hypothetical protein GGR53DRAFT_110357 [Hypoxylon sp. FL1150]|nr:hypothetical protein GGR53DRAFT_110357 [Hypoxylon sp. FL1150]